MTAGGSSPTRREAVVTALGAASVLAWNGAAAASRPTAVQIAERIRQAGGGTAGDLDGFVAGDPGITVTGIAVTAVPNIVALRKAVAQGCNMIVSPESPLYSKPAASGASPAAPLQADPTYAAKLDFIAKNRLAIYRLQDPSDTQMLAGGIAETMGWQRHRVSGADAIFAIPPTSLKALSASVKRRFGLNGGMRVIGQGAMPVRRVLVVPGRIDPVAVVRLLPQVDVLLAGDLREWELVEYFEDSWETQQPKALIAVGRILSEQPGMLALASRLRPVAGVPVRPILVDDPYWRLPA